jgi:peptide chain release factor subunit 1
MDTKKGEKMPENIDLRKLAETSSNDRAFLSLYFSSPADVEKFHSWGVTTAKMLKGNKEERKYLKENLKLVEKYFDKNEYKKGHLCIFACWLGDFFEAHILNISAGTTFIIDSSPFIRPLAFLQEEYEDFAVVAADNKKARIFLVSAGKAEEDEKIKGNIKNHVKVGGWSQQRYERRRDKELKLYAREIVERLENLHREKDFSRLIIVGSAETVNEIIGELPKGLTNILAGKKAIDIGRGEKFVEEEIFNLLFAHERKSEKELWTQIKSRYMSGGNAVVGAIDVLEAAKTGRVEEAIVCKEAKIAGRRCRDCENLSAGDSGVCPSCGSGSTFEVDLINEITELLELSSARIEFAEGVEELKEAGDIAALLRY